MFYVDDPSSGFGGGRVMADAAEYTVVFFGHPKNIKGNPFDLVTDFGEVRVLSIGNVCETADSFREALEQIADGRGDPAEIAQDALDEADAATAAAVKVRQEAAARAKAGAA
jgi:threonine dehydrogenase-like Zn-dependent dehydrogenase